MAIEQVLKHYPRPYLTDVELDNLLDGTANSRYGKVKRMLANGKLVRIRRGLYYLTEEIGYFKKPHPFELAQYIYGPSFISLESALSYHHLIPEAVYTTTSVTGKRSKEWKTPFGNFSFQSVSLEDLYTDVVLMKENGYMFYLARPWRAICDYFYCYRHDGNDFASLIQSLRINILEMPSLRREEIQLLDEYYQKNRMTQFLKSIQKVLSQSRNEILL